MTIYPEIDFAELHSDELLGRSKIQLLGQTFVRFYDEESGKYYFTFVKEITECLPHDEEEKSKAYQQLFRLLTRKIYFTQLFIKVNHNLIDPHQPLKSLFEEDHNQSDEKERVKNKYFTIKNQTP